MSERPATAPRDAASRGRSPRIRRNPIVWHVSRFCLWAFSKVWFRLRLEGRDRIPAEGPVLLVANHGSYIDPPVVGIASRREVDFLAQAGLAKLGPMRWWLAQVGVTLIDRDAPSKDAMRIIVECLRAGEVVGVFPEGTRSRDGSVGSFKSGVEFLVRRSKATVVPIGIDGTFRAYPRGVLLPRPRKVVVRCGEPWTPEQVLADGGVERLRRTVAELACAPLREADDADRHGAGRHNGTSATAAAVDPEGAVVGDSGAGTASSSPSSSGGAA